MAGKKKSDERVERSLFERVTSNQVAPRTACDRAIAEFLKALEVVTLIRRYGASGLPSQEEIRSARERVCWTTATAASSVLVSPRAWQSWEAGTRKMPPNTWLLFRLMTGATDRTYDTPKGRATLRLAVDAANRPATE